MVNVYPYHAGGGYWVISSDQLPIQVRPGIIIRLKDGSKLQFKSFARYAQGFGNWRFITGGASAQLGAKPKRKKKVRPTTISVTSFADLLVFEAMINAFRDGVISRSELEDFLKGYGTPREMQQTQDSNSPKEDEAERLRRVLDELGIQIPKGI